MQSSSIGIYGISTIWQGFSISIIAKSLLKKLSVFFKTDGYLIKSLVKKLPVLF